MVYKEEDIRRGQVIFQIACMLGHVPKDAQTDVHKFRDWWNNISEEHREAIFEDCAMVLENSKHEIGKKQRELAEEAPARKWLTGALPAMLALHSLFYAEWWQSILLFFGAAIAFRIFLLFWDYIKGGR
jgi:hypothetical protein